MSLQIVRNALFPNSFRAVDPSFAQRARDGAEAGFLAVAATFGNPIGRRFRQ